MKIVARRKVQDNNGYAPQQPNITQNVPYQANMDTRNSQQPLPNTQHYSQPGEYTNANTYVDNTPQLVQNHPSKAPIQPMNNLPRRTGWAYEYLLDNGQVVTTEQAYDMAMEGLLDNIQCSTNKGVKYIKTLPDGNPDNDLQELPSF